MIEGVLQRCREWNAGPRFCHNISKHGATFNRTKPSIPSNNDSSSSDSNNQEQSEGAISGLSNLKRKLAEIDKERELYKIEQTKMEDEISTVKKSLSKLGDQMIQMRQDMTAFSGNMRVELAETKNILLGMNNEKKASPR
jgi:septal ring factor EnvC (AmiA/AmiB activator)